MWLQEICRQPSVSAQKRGISETAKMVEVFLDEIGAAHEQVSTNGNPIVFGEIQEGRKRTLSFYNHYDVQPEDPLDEWDYEPFGAEIHEGKLFARGVADNKGNLMARISAVHAYQQVYGKLPVNIKFVVDGEEEVGSIHTHEIAVKHPEKVMTDGFIWESGYRNGDDRWQVRLGVKGMLYVELRAKTANYDIHSLNAPIVPNSAWRLTWALNTLKDTQEKVLIDGFYDNVKEPTETEIDILEKMAYSEESNLKTFGIPEFLNGISDYELRKRLIFEPTCTICGLDSGYTGEGSKTILPATAIAKIDFRLVAEQDPDLILELLRNHLDKHGFQDIEIHKISGKRSHKTDPNHPLAKTVMDVVRERSGKEPQVLINTPGTGPMAKLCKDMGIPAVGIGVGHQDSKIHAPNENIILEDYVEGIKMIAAIMERFAEEAQEPDKETNKTKMLKGV